MTASGEHVFKEYLTLLLIEGWLGTSLYWPHLVLSLLHRTLDLGAPLVMGSLPQNFQYGGILFQPFIGCIRNVFVNDDMIDFSEALAKENLSDGCRFADAQCDTNPCANDGTCVGVWGTHYCKCTPAFAGESCTKCNLINFFNVVPHSCCYWFDVLGDCL